MSIVELRVVSMGGGRFVSLGVWAIESGDLSRSGMVLIISNVTDGIADEDWSGAVGVSFTSDMVDAIAGEYCSAGVGFSCISDMVVEWIVSCGF